MITRHSWSVRTRLTLIAVATAALSGLVITTVATLALYDLARDYQTNQVAGTALEVVQLAQRGRLPAVLRHGNGVGSQVLDASGRIVAATPDLAGGPPVADFRPGGDGVMADRELCDPPRMPGECVIAVVFRLHRPEGDWLVYSVGAMIPWYVHSGLFAFLVTVSVLIVVLAGAGTYRTVTGALTPVHAITGELAEITATDVGRRVPVPRAEDEIRQLAETINQTLDRLEAAVEQQRRFASDASHDLRSPLTAMRTQVEEALQYPEDVDWTVKAQAMLASLDRLQAIVADLLTLARLDSGAPAAAEAVDLGGLADGELDRRPRRVEVIRKLESGVTVTGDPLRLARLLTNLMDNAERHAVSTVTVTVAAHGDTAVLEVLDDGAGIAPEQREAVFRRFTRLDAARSRDAGGTGLGLAIAREVAASHGGTLRVEDSPRGARFVLRLPVARP
ncbi:ATP-binding protein [Planomonospora sp. ID82291]|uniref:sensor histidine kinase n=1 Tax=Planomonospora sp. ID82291 TaxID=2738136 RepID=UPI0027DBF12E|nr:ATP-binding protein [Planomonospora sp. ID82291]